GAWKQILTHYRVRLAQLSPNSVRAIVAFQILCRLARSPFRLKYFFAAHYVAKGGPNDCWIYFSRNYGKKGELPSKHDLRWKD
ncbi:UNVERIFIED_CONTAM: hypothetical protein ITH22_24870, partial [Salmonella enterica subsp. enterica serovar Weltevreden]